MPSKPKLKPMKPRRLGLHLTLMNKSKRGGAHIGRTDKRVQNRIIRELKDEL